MRRYNRPPLSGIQYTHRPGAYGIFKYGDQFLLTGQTTKTRGLEWQLPGGGVEKGENPIEALTREALEETGWRVHVERKLGAWKQFTYMPEYKIHAEKICHIYVGRALYPMGEPLEDGHVAALVSPQKALAILVNQGDRDFLASFMRCGYFRL